MFRFSLAFLLTAWQLVNLPVVPDATTRITVAGLIALSAVLVSRRLWSHGAGFLPPAGGSAALLLLGALAATSVTLPVLTGMQHHRLPDALVDRDIAVSGTVVGIPMHEPRRRVFLLRIDSLHDAAGAMLAGQTVRVSWYGPPVSLRAAERWRMTLQLSPAPSAGNPGSFDYAGWLFQQGVVALARVRGPATPRRLATAPSWHLSNLREQAAKALARLGRAGATEGLVAALALGITHDIPAATRDVLRATGTAHLLAISGLHVALVAGWGLLAGALLWRLLPRRWCPVRRHCSAVVALLLATGYAALAGFGLPTRRAVLMLLIVTLAHALMRRVAPATVLQLAALSIVAVDPLSLLSIGFWLSFGTVAILIYLGSGHPSVMPGPLRRLRSACVMHVQLGLFMLPLTAWFFSTGSLVAPLANLLAVPVVGLLVVPLALLATALLPLGERAVSMVLPIAEGLLAAVLGVLGWLDGVGLQIAGTSSMSLPSPGWSLLAVAGVAVLCSPTALGWRWLAFPLLMPAVLYNTVDRHVDGLELHVLDVGQGLAVLVFTPQHTLLYDTGNWRAPGVSQIDSTVLPYLARQGRRRIDTIVISHPDSDHAAGSADLARHFPDARWLTSQPSQLPVPQAGQCVAGQGLSVDDVRFSFLSPAAHDHGSDNDRSCVLLIHHGRSRILLPGDIEAAAEKRLVTRALPLPVTVLLAPHHGSATSSSAAFLSMFSPAHVVFPAGFRNRFGFPHPRIILRYTVQGAVQHITGRDGAIRFVFDRDGLVEPPSAWRRTHRRWWQQQNWHRNRE